MRAPAIGELAMPSESSASMRERTCPLASSTQSIVSASVIAQPERVAALDVLLREDRLDLRPRAVDDDEVDAEAVQQVEVVDDAEERVVGDHLAAERDDERPAAERVDVRRRRADPLDERARGRGMDGRRGVRIRRHRGRRAASRRRAAECADYTAAAPYNRTAAR